MTDFVDTLEALRFDGYTFDIRRDGWRLTRQLTRVRAVMSDNNWHTLDEIHRLTGGKDSTAAISARLRDLRKERFGGYTVEREYVANGVWKYRVLVKD